MDKFDFNKARLNIGMEVEDNTKEKTIVFLRQPDGNETPFELEHAERILQRQLRDDPNNEKEDVWKISPKSDYEFSANRITLKSV